MAKNGDSEETDATKEAKSRLDALDPDMFAAAARAIEEGLIDPARFGITGDDIRSPLESGNPVGLEAIVKLVGRPPMLVENDCIKVDALATAAMGPGRPLHNLTVEMLVAMEPFMQSIGRVEFINHDKKWGGTGWVIEGGATADRRWVVTNRHVAALVAQRVHDGSGVFLRAPAGALYQARLDFGETFGSPVPSKRLCRVERVLFLADQSEADCALLEIIVSSEFRPGHLPLASGRATVGDLVATIGFPAYDTRNDAAPMQAYFGGIFNVKRFAPGYIVQSNPGELLMHDCTTLGGNSGSPLIRLEGEKSVVVGLHFSGKFGYGNSAVSVETLHQLKTGRLFVASRRSDTEAGQEVPADQEHDPSHFAGRQGYNPAHLGEELAVALPDMSPEIVNDLAIPSDANEDRPHELRYTNFGILYSKGRKVPRFGASHIDGSDKRRIKRAASDIWYFDLRIPREIQLGKKDYPRGVDRGHIVRREEPNSGPHAQRANDDTFHYTNCAFQHALLNRGRSLWLGLENYILDSSRTHGFKACVFTGPILAADDPLIDGGDIRIPREFWKIVAMPAKDGGLHATAYLLSQGDLIRKLLEQRHGAERGLNEAVAEGFELGAYRTFQVAVRHIEQETGLHWPSLVGADPLEKLRDEAVSPVLYQPVESPTDLIL